MSGATLFYLGSGFHAWCGLSPTPELSHCTGDRTVMLRHSPLHTAPGDRGPQLAAHSSLTEPTWGENEPNKPRTLQLWGRCISVPVCNSRFACAMIWLSLHTQPAYMVSSMMARTWFALPCLRSALLGLLGTPRHGMWDGSPFCSGDPSFCKRRADAAGFSGEPIRCHFSQKYQK